MPEAKKPTRTTGFACPECKGVRLCTETVRHPCAGRIVRYRKCSVCGFRLVTEERARAPKKKSPTS